MKIKIKESGEIRGLEYLSGDPSWQIDDVWDFAGFQPERIEVGEGLRHERAAVLPAAQYDRWSQIVARLEALDATGIEFMDYADEIDGSSIDSYVSGMERIARRLEALA